MHCTLRVEYVAQFGDMTHGMPDHLLNAEGHPTEQTNFEIEEAEERMSKEYKDRPDETAICSRGEDCVVGGKPLPLTTEYFYFKKSTGNLDSTCRECRKKTGVEQYRARVKPQTEWGKKMRATLESNPDQGNNGEYKLKIEFSATPELLAMARELMGALERFEAGVR